MNSDEKKIPFNENLNLEISLKEEIREAFTEWCKSSTSHGIPNIARAKSKIVKLMWVCFCLASISFCSYTIIKGFLDFLKYEVVVQIDVKMQSPTEFPAVTICNLIPFNKMKSRDFTAQSLADKNMTQPKIMMSLNGSNAIDYLRQITDALKSSMATYSNMTNEVRKNIGFDLESDMLISCSFNHILCNASDFLWTLSYDYGNCYTFNSGYDANLTKRSLLKTTKYGQNNGLHLEILVGNPNMHVEFVYKSGMYVLVHNQSFNPVQLDGGINVATGFETNIAVTREFRYKLDGYYSNCLKKVSDPGAFNSKLYKGFFNILNFTTYNQAFCFKLCYQDFVINICSCSDASIPSLDESIDKCHTQSQLACLSNTSTWFGQQDLHKNCLPSCPLECDSVIYTLNTNIANYPTTYYTNLLKLQPNLIDNFPMDRSDTSPFIKESILKISVNYDDNTYKQTNEIPAIDFGGLLANIGGQLGLFIGISILSIIEIFELVLEIIQILFIRKFIRQTRVQAFN